MNLAVCRERLDQVEALTIRGKVTKAVGLLIEGAGIWAPVGAKATIESLEGEHPAIHAEVVGFKDKKLYFMPLEGTWGIGPGSLIKIEAGHNNVVVGPDLLGRVLDGLGRPIDSKGPFTAESSYPLYQSPINPMERSIISQPMELGVRAIDGMLTCGGGQRVGIFAGSGVGKSTLLGMIAKNTEAELNVIAMIGERGREVNDFIHGSLGEEGLRKSVVVVSTSDQPPLLRKRAAFLAIAIAEYFRDQGKKVLFMMDSVTRFAMAQREIGLAIGEPPATKGYPPSVFAQLPVFFERAGNVSHDGSITGIYTVLVEGDDLNDPVADTVRSILDGHIVLSRELAAQGHFPPIDVLESISRVMPSVVTEEHNTAAQGLKSMLASYRRVSDLIAIGAYKEGSDPMIDTAIQLKPRIDAFLKQGMNDSVAFNDSLQILCSLAEEMK